MNLLVVLLMIFEWVWCLMMPIIGSLYLISTEYERENSSKNKLFSHWCYYWIIYVVLRIVTKILSIFLFQFDILFYALRVIILCVIVTPGLDLSTNISEKVLNRSEDFNKIKNACIKMFNEKILCKDDKKGN